MFSSRPPSKCACLSAVGETTSSRVTLGIVFALSLLCLRRSPDPAVELPTVHHFPGNSSTSRSRTDKPNNRPPVLTSLRRVRPAGPRFAEPGSKSSSDGEYTKAIVIARTKNEDVSWLDEKVDGLAITDACDVYIYTTDDLDAEHHTPLKKGREAMAYLTYIIEHYDDSPWATAGSAPGHATHSDDSPGPQPRRDRHQSGTLPEIVVFMHAHRASWHDNMFSLSSPQTVSSLRLARVARLGYMNLRCTWRPGCPDHIHPLDAAGRPVDPDKPEEAVFAAAWRELFPPDAPVPPVLSQACCAQFAVSRDRIVARPLSTYVAIRDWLLATELDDAISGRVLEYLYQVLWAGRAVYCPEEHSCYCDGYGICFGGKSEFEEYVAKTAERASLKERVEEMTAREVEIFGEQAVSSAIEAAEQAIRETPAAGVDEAATDEGKRSGHSRRSADHPDKPRDDDLVEQATGAEETMLDIGETRQDGEGVSESKAPKQPSSATVQEIVLLRQQIEKLGAWLEEGLAAAKERGREPPFAVDRRQRARLGGTGRVPWSYASIE